MKLHQIIALVQGKKSRAMKMLTSVHHGWSKERTDGLVRTYKPLNDDGEQFPGSLHIRSPSGQPGRMRRGILPVAGGGRNCRRCAAAIAGYEL